MNVFRKDWLDSVPPDALRLCLSTFLTSLPIGYLTIVLPIYFNKIGINPADIGGLYTVSSIVSAILLIVFGVVADRLGRKPFVIIGLALPMISYVLFLVTTDVTVLTLAAGIGGVGLANGVAGALSGAGFNALLAEKTTEANRTYVFSLGSAAWTVALMVGSLLAGLPEFLQANFGWAVAASYHPLFWISLGVTAFGVLAVAPVSEAHKPSAGQGWRALAPHRSAGNIAKLSLFMGLIGLGLGFSIQLMSLWFYLRFGVSGDFLGPFYALGEGLSVTAVYIVPRLTRALGTAKTLILTQGIASLVLAGMVIAPTPAFAALLYLMRQYLMNLAWPAQQSYIMGAVDPAERATASSLTFGAWSFANAASPRLAGEWLSQGRLELPILAGVASYLLSVGSFWLFFRRTHLPVDAEPAPVS
ncbi:MAG: MFS transporter [Chloroflexi bacterium]|nr:MFS transporter [Chloroflexota bacterium]